MTRKNSSHASAPRIAIISHITVDELRAEMTDLSAGNGFANRFVYAAVRRSKALPFGGNIEHEALEALARKLKVAQMAAPYQEIRFDRAAEKCWREIYPELSEGRHGIYGSITARSETQAIRLALIYALLDSQEKIGIGHLGAALEVVRYSNESVRFVFGDTTGNRTADTIMRALRANPDGMTRSAISSDLFGRNAPADQIGEALSLLLQFSMIYNQRVETGGRPTEIWKAVV
jgi:hypothetical protein